jgi:aspartate racemase
VTAAKKPVDIISPKSKQYGSDPMNEKVVGVLGGMGPEATVELMRRVITATPVEDDSDHIHMIVDNNTKVPSRIKALHEKEGNSPAPILISMAQRLEQAGCDLLVMPCNSAHHYLPQIQNAISIPLWDMIRMTFEYAAADLGENRTLGLLGSPSIRSVALYESYAQRYGMQIIYPSNNDALLEIVRAIKSRRFGIEEKSLLQFAMNELSQTADAVILACTEFSLIGSQLLDGTELYDPLQILSDKIVEHVKSGLNDAPSQPEKDAINASPMALR